MEGVGLQNQLRQLEIDQLTNSGPALEFINVETANGIRTFNLAGPGQHQAVEQLFASGEGRQVCLGVGDNAAQQRIPRLVSIGLPEEVVIGIVD